MRKLFLFMAVAYTVVKFDSVGGGPRWEIETDSGTVTYCEEAKDYCDDLAQALNEAHEQRTRGPLNTVNCGNKVLEGYGVTEKDCKQ